MKKKVIGIFVVVCVAVIGAAIWAFFNAQRLVNEVKPKIEQAASQAIGTKVSLGDLSVSLFPTIHLTTSTFSLGEGANEGVKVKEVSVQLKLLPLLQRKVEIGTIVVKEPSILLEKTASGIGVVGLKTPSKGEKIAPTSSSSPSDSSPPNNLTVTIEKLSVKDGMIILNDKVAKKTFSAKEFTLFLEGSLAHSVAKITTLKATTTLTGEEALDLPLSLTVQDGEYTLDGQAVTFPNYTLQLGNSTFEGKGSYNMKNQSGEVTTNSSSINMAEVARLASAFSGSSLPVEGTAKLTLKTALANSLIQNLEGNIDLKKLTFTQGAHRLEEGNGTISFEGPQNKLNIQSKEFSLKYNEAPLKVRFEAIAEPPEISVPRWAVEGFSGEAHGNFELAKGQVFSTKVEASSLSITEMLKVIKSNSAFTKGTLQSLKATLRGTLGASLLQSTNGDIVVSVKDTILENVNLPQQVFQKLQAVPLLAEVLLNKVPPKYAPLLTAKDTAIKGMNASVQLNAGEALLRDILVTSDIFELEGNGRVLLTNNNVDLRTTFTFNKEFSEILAEGVKELRALLNEERKLSFPLQIQGVPPKLLILPEVDRLLAKGARKLVEEKGKDLLKGLLKNKEKQGEAGDLVEGLLGGL